jgi:hypothetical protein
MLLIRIGFIADPDPAFYLSADPDPNPDSSSQCRSGPGHTPQNCFFFMPEPDCNRPQISFGSASVSRQKSNKGFSQIKINDF